MAVISHQSTLVKHCRRNFSQCAEGLLLGGEGYGEGGFSIAALNLYGALVKAGDSFYEGKSDSVSTGSM